LGPVALGGERGVHAQTVKNNTSISTEQQELDTNELGGRNTVEYTKTIPRELRESVVEVRRVNDRLMIIKLVVGQCTVNVVSAYAPHIGLDEEVKLRFWEGLDEIIRVYDEVHGGFGFGERNGGGTSLLDFAKAFGLVVANSCFPKREEHL
uniref:Uncharacterized protein LOC104247518 n=1 Tax=Nicotiana sylvestris TaxID=4096 RepID=A0A1U7YCP5_NICSY